MTTIFSEALSSCFFRESSDPDTDCGPTSGAMILDYFDNYGWDGQAYSSIKGLEYYGSQGLLIDHVAVDMDTGFYGTAMSEWRAGFLEHTNDHAPYTFSATIQTTEDYGQYKSSINDDRPVGVYIGFVDQYYWYHWVAGRGYEHDTNLGTRLMKINNSRGTTDWIDYDAYSEGEDLAFIWVYPG